MSAIFIRIRTRLPWKVSYLRKVHAAK